MARATVRPSQELADAHTLAAQRYAGYLVGHSYRNNQQSIIVTVDRQHAWKEPAIVADDCIFCARLTDEEAKRRVLGFQFAIDKEVTYEYWMPYMIYGMYGYVAPTDDEPEFLVWINSGSEDVPEPGKGDSRRNLRRFIELFQDGNDGKDSKDGEPTKAWVLRPLPLCKLPLRLQRKLCVEWNHIYLAWMQEHDLQYDFEKHEFWHEVPDRVPPSANERGI